MNLDSLSFALSQISYSVANLTKKNYKSSISEIKNLVQVHGQEAERHLFRCLFSHVDFSCDGKGTGKDFHQAQFLGQEFASLINLPNFVSVLCCAVDSPLHHQNTLKPGSTLLPHICRTLKLSPLQELLTSLALCSSTRTEIVSCAGQFLKQKLSTFITAESAEATAADLGVTDLSTDLVHFLLTTLTATGKQFDVSPDQVNAFSLALQRRLGSSGPSWTSPLFIEKCGDYNLKQLSLTGVSIPKSLMDMSLADVILEAGYSFTSSLEECRSSMTSLGVRELTPASVARVLCMMARTASGHIQAQDGVPVQSMTSSGWSDSGDRSTGENASQMWNVDVFVQTVKELAPTLNWREVVRELDHKGFRVDNKQAFRFLCHALMKGVGNDFPVEHFYRRWKNPEGQLSWLILSLENPDVFCFADHPCRAASYDALRNPPDEENREVMTWKNLDLVDLLLTLSETHLKPVMALFAAPANSCPDLLLLTVLQSSTSWNAAKTDLVSSLLPLFLGNHPNSVSMLTFAWTFQPGGKVRTLLMHAMAEWYMRGEPYDQGRLTRILDLAQDLKALSMLLTATPHAFVIDLACLASRREYLKLDKFVSDKLKENGEQFASAIVSFLRKRFPPVTGSAVKDDQLQVKALQLPQEVVHILLMALQNMNCSTMSKELVDAIKGMIANFHNYMMRARMATSAAAAGGVPVGAPPNTAPPPPVGATKLNMPPPQSAAPMSSLPERMPEGAIMSGALGSNNMAPIGHASAGLNLLSSGYHVAPGANLPGQAVAGAGSPAKPFPTAGINVPLPPTTGFNPMQPLTSQLQGLNLSTSIATALSAAPGAQRPTPTLGLLSANSLKQHQGAAAVVAAQQSISDRLRQAGAPNPSIPPITAATVATGGSSATSTDMPSIFPAAMSQQFTKEVEDEANSYFQRIYNHPPHPTIQIDEVLEMLKRFKDSQKKSEREVFSCMLRNLFEEYRFFPQYPDKELNTTAVLFGGIIEQGLVTYMDLGIALRYVLEALKKPQATKMHLFGLAALDKFRTRLKDYPQYCQHLASIPHFKQFPQHLIDYVEHGARSREPPNQPSGPVMTSMPPPPPPSSVTSRNLTPVSSAITTTTTIAGAVVSTVTTSTVTPTPVAKPVTSGKPSIANTTNIDTLLAGSEGQKEDMSVPPEQVQDKVFFIFNNLSLTNMEAKAKELLDAIGEDFIGWVAQYMVMKRASIEPNFHMLYSTFIESLSRKDLATIVVNETFRNIKVLLKSDKGAANFSDRSLLKNLGHWLGMITLNKNKPILHLDLDLKSLVYEAYHKGQQELLYVVPFVAKVLESCSKSKVFKPPNPWTMAVMNVLAELHQDPELKLNLKFEIEVLCKAMDLEVTELSPVFYLRDESRKVTLRQQLSSKADPSPPTRNEVMKLPSLVQKDPFLVAAPEDSLVAALQPHSTLPVVNASATVTTSAGGAVTSISAQPPQPKFSFQDVNVTSLAGLSAIITVNETLHLFQAQPQLKQFVRPAIERSVSELVGPVVERSIKIALTTCEQIIKKDFALDPEESRMRNAAHHMVRNMTAGMALITCREPLLIAINNNIKTAFLGALRAATPATKELVEQVAQIMAQDNVEAACTFIQKTAVEKALPEVDKRLSPEFDLRKHARTENRRYCDPTVLTYQAERMPEQIRLKVGGVTSQQIAVYEEFARNIPGFLPASGPQTSVGRAPQAAIEHALTEVLGIRQGTGTPTKAAPSGQPPQMNYMEEMPQITQIYNKVVEEMEKHVQLLQNNNNPLVIAIRNLIEATILARNTREVVTAVALLTKAVEGLLDGLSSVTAELDLMVRFRDCHLLVLRALQDTRAYGPQWTSKQVTRVIIECRDEFKYNVEAIDCLLQAQLINVQQFDLHLAAAMEQGVNYLAVHFCVSMLKRFCVDQKQAAPATEADFPTTIEMLLWIGSHARQSHDGLNSLMDQLRPSKDGGIQLLDREPGSSAMMHSGLSQAREVDDPPGLHDKTEFLLRDWVTLYHSPLAGKDSTKAFSAFVGQMHQQGILKTDELITRFFRLCTEMCVDLCYRALAEPTHSPTLLRAKCFHTLDAFVRLIALLVKHSGEQSNTVTKINLLNKVLGIVAGVLLQDHEVRKAEFQQLPYHRIFIMLFIELNAPDPVLESINFEVLKAFSNTFHVLRPTKAPAFSYAWLELISHRVFIGRMLAIPAQQRGTTPSLQGWNMYAQLLIDLFKFLTPFLRNAELSKPTQMLYKGALRVLLVLLHDFPEFLCDYHYAFCDVIPPNCIQMRNLILSAFPRSMRLPDPFTPNLKVDMLNEISHTPRILANLTQMIQPASFRKDLDSYLKTRSPVTFLSELRSALQQSSEPGMRYNIPLINALVLHVGSQAITFIFSKGHSPSMSTIAHSSHMDIFQNLAVDLDTEGRYLFLNAIANQLRYPNSHTHYFSCALLNLFFEANTEAIQEQITRVLLERLIVNRPHPWGLLITFIELIKNPQFKFWNHDFVHCAPEIEKLFDSVARSCMPANKPTVPGGATEEAHG